MVSITLLKHITLIRTKYAINSFYIKHQIYLLPTLDNVEELLQRFNDVKREEAKASKVDKANDQFCLSLYLDTKSYKISSCRNQVSDKMAEPGVFISLFLIFMKIIFRKQKCIFLNLVYLSKHGFLHLTQFWSPFYKNYLLS